MAEILEYYNTQYFSHYLLQRTDSTDHTFTGYQPGTGADKRRSRQEIHVHVLCDLYVWFPEKQDGLCSSVCGDLLYSGGHIYGDSV